MTKTVSNIVEELLENTFHRDRMWQSGRMLLDLKGDVYPSVADIMNSMERISIYLLFTLALFQVVIILFRTTQTLENPAKKLYPLIFKVVLLSIFLKFGMYEFLVLKMISAPPDLLSKHLMNTYRVDMIKQWSDAIGVFADLSVNGWYNMAFTEITSSAIIGSIIFFGSSVLVIVISFFQAYFFIYLAYLGPICIVFWVNDATKQVASAWLKTSLAIAWMGLLGSAVFAIICRANLFDFMKGSDGVPNVVVASIYGVVLIFMILTIYPVSAYFFGGFDMFQIFKNTAVKTGGKIKE